MIMTGQKVTVSVIVYCAKGLRPPTGKHKFSVSCEIGSQKCRTEVVEDFFGNPTFNKSFNFSVELPIEEEVLVMLITDKQAKNVLGQVTVGLKELVHRQENNELDDELMRCTATSTFAPRRVALEPHKTCSSPTGELVFDAWLSNKSTLSSSVNSTRRPTSLSLTTPDVRSSEDIIDEMSLSTISTSKSGATLKKIRERFGRSPASSPISFVFAAESSATISGDQQLPRPVPNRRHSVYESLLTLKHDRSPCRTSSPFSSAADVDHFIPIDNLAAVLPGLSEEGLDGAGDFSHLYRRKCAARLSLASNDDDFETGYRKRWSLEKADVFAGATMQCRSPIVTSISKSYGPTEGGTTIIVNGLNLGVGRDDIVALSVCGCDVLDSLNYVSAEQLICTTGAWRACVGPIVVETASGGRTGACSMSSAIQFTFTDSNFDVPTGGKLFGSRQLPVEEDNSVFNSTPNPSLRTDSDHRNSMTASAKSQTGDRSDTEEITLRSKQRGVNVPSAATIISGFKDIGRRLKKSDAAETNRRRSWTPVKELADVVEKRDAKADRHASVIGDSNSRISTKGNSLRQQPRDALRPPVVEIYPMRKHEDDWNNVVNDSKEPKKPRRMFGKSIGMLTDVLSEQPFITDKELIAIAGLIIESPYGVRNLEAQLNDNQTEISLLADQNKTLREQYNNLHFYIEQLLTRVIDNCPEILSNDNN